MIIIIFGIIFLFVGYLFYKRHQNLKKNCTVQTTGEVIRIEQEDSTDSDGHTSTYDYPVYRYMAGGKQIEKRSKSGSSRSKFSEGELVTVMYNSENTEQFYIIEDKMSGMFGIAFMIISLVICIIGIISLFYN